MTKNNKFLYGWKIYVDYGQGWEYQIFEETLAGMRENAKAYRTDCQYPVKIVEGREPNPRWTGNTLTKKEAIAYFKKHILPSMNNGDKPLVRMAWNNWTDSLCKEKRITQHQYDTWHVTYSDLVS